MKNLFTTALSTTLLACTLGSNAQQAPTIGATFELGSSQAIVQQFKKSLGASALRQAPPKVLLRVSANQAFEAQVNHHERFGQKGEYMSGSIAGVENSSFWLQVENNDTRGVILLPDSKQAFKYSSNSQGQVQVRQVGIGEVICVNYPKSPDSQSESPTVQLQAAAAAAPPPYQSYPRGAGCLFLDTDGYNLPANSRWNKNKKPYKAAASGFSAADIKAMWEVVSEDFRPFHLNVTTDEAVFNKYPKNKRVRCVVSPSSEEAIAPGYGGIALVGGFAINDDEPCWVFVKGGRSSGEAASHEFGHTLGLLHASRLQPRQEYFAGHGDWAPIMGASYYKKMAQWCKGEYNGAVNSFNGKTFQDELAIISGSQNGVGYRKDDHGNTATNATPLVRNGTNLTGGGLIASAKDTDYFSFATGGGIVHIDIAPLSQYANIKMAVAVYTSDQKEIANAIGPEGTQDVKFDQDLGADTYYLKIYGYGEGNPATNGFSAYASLGNYTVKVVAPSTAGVATFYQDCQYSGKSSILPAGSYKMAALQARGIINDDLSSLKVNSGYQVILYENDNFTGKSLTLSGAVACLGTYPLGKGNWNDMVTSLKIVKTANKTANLTADALATEDSAAPLELYPNPTAGLLTLTVAPALTNATFSILNVTGQVVRTGQLASSTLDVSDLPSGLYLLSVPAQAGQPKQTLRFVKQ